MSQKRLIEYSLPDGYEPEKAQIKTPPEFLHMIEDLRTLKADGDNPNKLNKRKQKATWRSLSKYGWAKPIVTDLEGLFSDGEHRVRICIEKGEFYGPVLRLPVNDIDRRLLRQILNKLHGEHIKELDAQEFKKIIGGGYENQLLELIDITEDKVKKTLKLIDTSHIDKEDKDTEQPQKTVKCPACGWEFNPDIHTLQLKLEIPDDKTIFESTIKLPHKDQAVTLNLDLQTTPPIITDNTLAVSEAFGIGLDETIKFSLFKKLEISYSDGDLIYVTGDSGGGKTTLLRLFGEYETLRGKTVINFNDVEPSSDETIIDGLGLDTKDNMQILNIAGLGEAFLMIRKYSELSDGQRYRYRLAKMMSKKAEIYLIDEFCATLDRVQAKILSYSIQKWARLQGCMILFATCHHDLIEDLNPDLIIYKGFGDDVNLVYRDPTPHKMSLERFMKIEKATHEEYMTLDRYHYIPGEPLIATNRFKLTYRDQIIGVIIYVSTFMQLALRNKVFPEYKGNLSQKEELSMTVNRDIVRLSRIIIHPKFRGVGLAQKLVRETLPLTGKRIVETVAAMPKYNPFFEKAGMIKVGVMPIKQTQKNIVKTIEALGAYPALMHSPSYRIEFVKKLTNGEANQLKSVLNKELNHVGGIGRRGLSQARHYRREFRETGLESMIKNLMPVERVYLYWLNPEMKQIEDIRANSQPSEDNR